MVHIPTESLYPLDRRAHITAINFQYNNCFDPTAAKTDLGYRYTISIALGAKRIYTRLLETGRLENSDQVPQDERILAAWERLNAQLKQELSDLA
jgi:hypothetical protein